MPEVAILVILLAFGLVVARLIYKQHDERHRKTTGTLAQAGEGRTAVLSDLFDGKALDVPQFASGVIIGFDRGMVIIALTDAKGHVTVVEWSEGFTRRFLSKPKRDGGRFSGDLLAKQ